MRRQGSTKVVKEKQFEDLQINFRHCIVMLPGHKFT